MPTARRSIPIRRRSRRSSCRDARGRRPSHAAGHPGRSPGVAGPGHAPDGSLVRSFCLSIVSRGRDDQGTVPMGPPAIGRAGRSDTRGARRAAPEGRTGPGVTCAASVAAAMARRTPGLARDLDGQRPTGSLASLTNDLRRLRESSGPSQGQLAAKLKVSRQTVDAIETGRSLPAIPPAVAIARSSRTAHRGGLPWRPCPGGPCRLSA